MAIGRESTLPCVASRTRRTPQSAQKHFAATLRRWVDERHNGNQTAAATALGISQGHVSAMLSGARTPGVAVLLLLRDELGISIDAMLGLSPLEGASPAAAELLTRLASIEHEIAAVRAAQETPPAEPKVQRSTVRASLKRSSS